MRYAIKLPPPHASTGDPLDKRFGLYNKKNCGAKGRLRESMAGMADFWRKYDFFMIGVGFILLALGSVYFGVCPGRGTRVYRDKNPKSFWLGVAVYLLGGILFWIQFWYRSS